jgi:transposase-like protein
MGSGKRYNAEFKLQAARLVVEQGYTYEAASGRLGVTSWSIRNWVKSFRAAGQLPPASQVVPEAEEMKQLRKDNRRLQMEVEILKKAAAYFAKESL